MSDDRNRPPSAFHSLEDTRTWKCMPGGVFVWEHMEALVRAGIAPPGTIARRWKGPPAHGFGPDAYDVMGPECFEVADDHIALTPQGVARFAANAWRRRHPEIPWAWLDFETHSRAPLYARNSEFAARVYQTGEFPRLIIGWDMAAGFDRNIFVRSGPHPAERWADGLTNPLRNMIINPKIVIEPKGRHDWAYSAPRRWFPMDPTELAAMRRTNRFKTWKNWCVGLGFLNAFLCLATWGVALVTDQPAAWLGALWFLGGGLLFEAAGFCLGRLEGRL